MKEIKLKVSDEIYEAYMLDCSFQINSSAGNCVWDDDYVISYLGSGYRTEIEQIKNILIVLKFNSKVAWGRVYGCHFRNGISTYKDLPTIKGMEILRNRLQEPATKKCIRVWNKYHPNDKIIVKNDKIK